MKKVLMGMMCLLAAVMAGAQEERETVEELAALSFEELMKVEVVSAASRVLQTTREAPSSVTIVTAQQIRTFGHRTLGDILRSVRGFWYSYDRNYTYLGVRGFARPGDYNGRVLLLIDGTPVNENVYGSMFAGEDSLVDPAMIDRVEIVRGAASSIYGSNAFFAVVNVITRTLGSTERAEAAASVGSYGTLGGRVALGFGSPDRVGFDLSGSIHDSDGPRLYYPEYDSPETSNGITSGTDFESAWRYLANLRSGDLTLQAFGVKREKGVPTGAFEVVFDDPRNRSWDELHILALGWKRAYAEGRDLRLRVSAGRYVYDQNYAYDVINRDEAVGQWWNVETVGTLHRSARNTTLAGIEIQSDYRQDQTNFYPETGDVDLDVSDSNLRVGGFLQTEVRLHERARATLGVRYDDYETFGGRWSPRGALVVDLSPASTIKLIAGEAFRAPTTYELNYEQEGTQITNPALRPETIQSYEIAYERLFGPETRLIASAFRNSLSSLIDLVETGEEDLLQFQNRSGSIRSTGVEIQIDRMWSGAGLSASYTHQSTETVATGEPLTNTPEHLLKAHLKVLLPRASTLGVEALYTSTRTTERGVKVDSFAVVNATMFVPLPRGVTIDASVNNLFDESYADPGGLEHLQDLILQNGRTYRLQLTMKFAR